VIPAVNFSVAENKGIILASEAFAKKGNSIPTHTKHGYAIAGKVYKGGTKILKAVSAVTVPIDKDNLSRASFTEAIKPVFEGSLQASHPTKEFRDQNRRLGFEHFLICHKLKNTQSISKLRKSLI
jgi:hypothetical protein